MHNSKTVDLKFVSVVVLVAMLKIPLAKAGDTLEANISACRSISDSVRRLACFDSIEIATILAVPQLPVRRELHASSRAESIATAAEPNAKPIASEQAGPKDSNFGSETVQVKPSDQSRDLNARALGTFNGISKGQRIKLDNGQVWQDIDDRSYDYEATAPEVHITRNFAGNYWMKLSDSSFQFRVRRVQ